MNGINKKKCCKCNQLLKISFFDRSFLTKDTYSNICQFCTPTKQIKPKIKKSQFISNKLINVRQKQWWNYYDKGCCICGEKETCCLDFHHIDPKNKTYAVSKIWGVIDIQILIEEIQKCIIVCKNCHSKIHNNKLSMEYFSFILSENPFLN